PPSVENCQLPFVLSTAVTAIPVIAPLSTSVILPEISAERSVPLLVTSSSLMVARLFDPERTGASLTALTVMPLLAVSLLYDVLPPLLVVSAVPPAVPVVWSQARNDRPA